MMPFSIFNSSSEDMCYTISEIKEKTIPIAKGYGIKKMSLFGPYARSSADDESIEESDWDNANYYCEYLLDKTNLLNSLHK